MYSIPISKCKGFYTGVGSRQTPMHCLYLMSKLAIIFEKQNYILRSGCALGADAAFEDILESPQTHAEIYIPNIGFPLKMGTNIKNHYIVPKEDLGISKYEEAMRLIHSKKIHKGWEYCKQYVMNLHNRNMFQALGKDLSTKSRFTVCYTKNGAKKYEQTDRSTGGTATAINASDLHGIEVFNIGNKEDYVRLENFIEKNKNLIDQEKLNKMVIRSELNPQKMPYSSYLNQIEQEKQKFLSKSKRRPSLR